LSKRHRADDNGITREITKRSHPVAKDDLSASDLIASNIQLKINNKSPTNEYKLVKSGVSVSFSPTPLKTQVSKKTTIEVRVQPVKQQSDNNETVKKQVTQVAQIDIAGREKHTEMVPAPIYSSVSASDHHNEQQKSLSSTASASVASFTPSSSKVIATRRIQNSPSVPSVVSAPRNPKISPGSVRCSRPSSVADMRDAAKAAREKVRKKMEATSRKLSILAVALPLSYTILFIALCWLITTLLANPDATFSSQVNSTSIKYEASLDFVIYSQLLLLGVIQYYAYVPPPLQPHSRPASRTESPRAGGN